MLVALGLILSGCASNLNRAITHHRKPEIDQLIASGADINARDGNGASPLINAAQFGDLALIKKLLDHGAQIKAFDHEGNTALMYVCAREKPEPEVVALLLSHGADPNEVNHAKYNSLLIAAAQPVEPADAEKKLSVVSQLLKAGADANLSTRSSELPLHLAARSGQPNRVLEAIFHATMEPHALTQSGFNAFTEAGWADRRPAATYLATLGLEFQPVPPRPESSAPPSALASPDPTLPGAARTNDAYGDYLHGLGNNAGALEHYQTARTSYDAAVVDYRRAVDQFTAALKDEKSARRGKWASTVAWNTLGVGLAAATGVGFFVVPKTLKNHVDDYSDELERDQAELKVLLAEQSEIASKIQATPLPKPEAPAAAPSSSP